MNNLFKKEKMIQLDDKYTLSPDSDNGVVLTFSEERNRKKIDKVSKKETGEIEKYNFSQSYYYPRVSQALSKFAELNQNDFKGLEDLKTRVESTFQIINNFNKQFNQF